MKIKEIWYKLKIMGINAEAKLSRFIILIPGRDTEKFLNEYRTALFASGFHGAYSFPPAAPLAEVSRAFSRDELKEFSVNIRNLTITHDGKISSAESCTNGGFGKLSFYGPRLDLPEGLFNKTAKRKIVRTFFPTVLCAALIDSGSGSTGIAPQAGKCPALSFRAAAIANVTIRSLISDNREALPYSFEWETGSLVWLPAYKKPVAGK
jgi:hypothetical protein